MPLGAANLAATAGIAATAQLARPVLDPRTRRLLKAPIAAGGGALAFRLIGDLRHVFVALAQPAR